jgi:hypothetical protein
MDLELVSQVWQELKHHVNDKTDASDALVNVLMENGGNIDEIKSAFNDRDITKALKAYDDNDLHEEEEDDYEDDWTEEDDY